jgi:hypothetical protein
LLLALDRRHQAVGPARLLGDTDQPRQQRRHSARQSPLNALARHSEAEGRPVEQIALNLILDQLDEIAALPSLP